MDDMIQAAYAEKKGGNLFPSNYSDLIYYSQSQPDYHFYLKDDRSIIDPADRGKSIDFIPDDDYLWLDNHQSSSIFNQNKSIEKDHNHRHQANLRNCLPWRQYLIE
jgi:hypothetical protein